MQNLRHSFVKFAGKNEMGPIKYSVRDRLCFFSFHSTSVRPPPGGMTVPMSEDLPGKGTWNRELDFERYMLPSFESD